MYPVLVCPICGNPSFDVDIETVKNFVELSDNLVKKWGLCSNPNCDVSYHTQNIVYYCEDLKIKIWYKTKSKDVPICYCSNLTRKEIELAVKEGKNSIDEVQEFTKKNITGQCKKLNPIGRCCRNAFIYTIENKK